MILEEFVPKPPTVACLKRLCFHLARHFVHMVPVKGNATKPRARRVEHHYVDAVLYQSLLAKFFEIFLQNPVDLFLVFVVYEVRHDIYGIDKDQSVDQKRHKATNACRELRVALVVHLDRVTEPVQLPESPLN